MNAERRREISELVTKMLARKYRCGLAGEHAVRDLWDENIELRARVALLEKVAEAAAGLNTLIASAQEVLSEYLQPSGTAEAAIDSLLGLFDGPRQREIQNEYSTAIVAAKEGK